METEDDELFDLFWEERESRPRILDILHRQAQSGTVNYQEIIHCNSTQVVRAVLSWGVDVFKLFIFDGFGRNFLAHSLTQCKVSVVALLVQRFPDDRHWWKPLQHLLLYRDYYRPRLAKNCAYVVRHMRGRVDANAFCYHKLVRDALQREMAIARIQPRRLRWMWGSRGTPVEISATI